MEFIGLYDLEGKFLGASEYKAEGKDFPLIYIHFLRTIDSKPVKLLADKERWNTQGGDNLKPPDDIASIAYSIYSTMNEGQEILLHIFEDILEVK